MPIQMRTLYQSSNGDRWSLAQDSDTARVFVRHEANVASGGRTTDTALGDFLNQPGMGTEKQELLRMIGSLTEA